MKSIMQTEKECYFCKTTIGLELHHIFNGANRKISDKDGCTVYLCARHHRGGEGVHFNKILNLTLKAECQRAWEETYGKTTADFITRYGKNYR